MLLQEMQEIFGDVDDLLEMYAEQRATVSLGKDGEEEDEAEALELADEEDPDAVAAHDEQMARLYENFALPAINSTCTGTFIPTPHFEREAA